MGKDGQPFELWKLRTMVVGAEHLGAGLYVTDRDPRITRSGRLLRRFSLDELPNLLNVLEGDLATVGPRPTVAVQVDRYTPHQRRRLEVRPGITGWAQVHGRTALSWPERIELDVWYVERRSLALDLRILARTVKLLGSGEGLYSSDLEQGWGKGNGKRLGERWGGGAAFGPSGRLAIDRTTGRLHRARAARRCGAPLPPAVLGIDALSRRQGTPPAISSSAIPGSGAPRRQGEREVDTAFRRGRTTGRPSSFEHPAVSGWNLRTFDPPPR